MHERARHLKVGLFVVVTLVLFLVLLVFAIGTTMWKDTTTYLIRYDETVKGMVVGSPVNFQGVTIGSVSDMRFVDGRTEVEVVVDPTKAPIQAATHASLDRAWVTGQVTVELGGYEPGAPILAEGSVIRSELSTPQLLLRSMPELFPKLVDLLEEYGKVGMGLNRFLEPENVRRILSLVEKMGRVMDQLGDQSLPAMTELLAEGRSLLPELESNLRTFEELAQNLKRLSGHPALEGMLVGGEKLAHNLGAASKELGHLLRSNERELRSALGSMGVALEELQGLMRILRSTPSALIFGRPLPERAMRGGAGRNPRRASETGIATEANATAATPGGKQ